MLQWDDDPAWNADLSKIPEPDLYGNTIPEQARLNIILGTTTLNTVNNTLDKKFTEKDLYPDKIMRQQSPPNPMMGSIDPNLDGRIGEKVFYENEAYMDESRRLKKALKNFPSETYIDDNKDSIYNSQFVGEEAYIWGPYKYFFSRENLHRLSAEITKLLQEQLGKKIVVTDRVIQGVMNILYRDRPNLPVKVDYPHMTQALPSAAMEKFEPLKAVNTKTISIIVQAICDEYGVLENNDKLDIWVTQYTGDPKYGSLLQHPKIRYRRNTKSYMNFNMNY